MFFHFNDVPVGLQDFPSDGWPGFVRAAETDPVPLRIAGFDAPQTFHTTIVPTTAGGRPLDEWELQLLFRADVEEQSILLAGALSNGLELNDALDRVRKARPLRWWQRRALIHVVSDVSERSAAFQFYDGEDGWDVDVPDDVHDEAAQWRAQQGRAAEAVQLGQRRNRVNRQLLEEVATVYRAAHEAGDPPTQAVAEHFGRPHSTAARWVARARKDGLLGPADGSRGGEVK